MKVNMEIPCKARIRLEASARGVTLVGEKEVCIIAVEVVRHPTGHNYGVKEYVRYKVSGSDSGQDSFWIKKEELIEIKDSSIKQGE